MVPQTYFWAFCMLDSGNCLRFDTRAHLLAFLWPLEGQILPHKDSKEVCFQGKSIQNLVKTSPWLSHRLTFEPFTHEIVGIVWDLMPGLICRPFYGPYKVKYCLWILKKVNFQGKLTRNLVKTSPPRLLWRLTFETFTHAVVRIGQDLIFWGTLWGQCWSCIK